MTEQKQPQEIPIDFPGHLKGGVYCNNMIVTHTKEESIMDFVMIARPSGAVTAHVIISPVHMKRVIYAVQDSLKKYEGKFGKITAAEEPPKGKLGFPTP